MGIRLDWEIEAEKERVKSSREDPEAVRNRRRTQRRFLLLIVFLLFIAGLIIGGTVLRLEYVDSVVEQGLRSAVEAEIAALRVGDRDAFLRSQRSATSDWENLQSTIFDTYQDLKLTTDLNLTGQILDVVIEGQRGRVIVQEIINDAPFARVWFYWRYEEGWFHVPPDYTFWGDVVTLDESRYSIRYQSVDAPFATAIAESFDVWFTLGCTVIDCSSLPKITVDIHPNSPADPAWSSLNEWQLVLTSPFVQPVRMDQVLNPNTKMQIATLMAERLVNFETNQLEPLYPADVFYLKSAIVSWLVGQFTNTQTNSFFIASIADQLTPARVGNVLRAFTPTTNVSELSPVLGVANIAEANVDWRDFLTWRLRLEQDFLASRDRDAFFALYDGANPTSLAVADSRFNAGSMVTPQVVVSAAAPVQRDGSIFLNVLVQVGEGENRQQIETTFRWDGFGWKRWD